MHAGAPFLELCFDYRYLWDNLTLRQHSQSLLSAYAIRWTFQTTLKIKSKPERRSTDLLSVSAASFRHALSILSVSSSLHTLGLSSIRVEPAHQILILSIKTLQTLELVNSMFVPTSVVMPHSLIKALLLEGWSSVPIALLGSSLEVLRLKWWKCQPYDREILASTPLPRLTFLDVLFMIKVPTQDYFASFRNIRTLILRFLGHDPVPPTALPHLTYLSAPHDVGKALLPGRPVHTYHDSYVWHSIRAGSPLVELAPYAQHVKELHISFRMSPWEVAVFLALHFPNVVRLHLNLSWSDQLDDGDSPQSRGLAHHSLREFDIGFYVTKGQWFPREKCRKALMSLTEVCTALEAVRFGELFPVNGGGIDERDVRLDWVMDMRRTAGGEWQERTWWV